MTCTKTITVGRARRSLALAATGAMILSVAPSTSAMAAVSDICPPPDASSDDAFSDDDGSPHEANIDCAAGYGLVKGSSATEFNPGGALTRGQAATILVEWAETALGTPLTTNGADEFSDTEGTTHETSIDKAADNGFVKGFADGTYRPGETIPRNQFATIAVMATEFVLKAELSSDDTDDFSDDDGVHEPNIEKAADNGIISGTGDGTFSPGVDVVRAQTATIVIQAAGEVLHPAGEWTPSDIPAGEPAEAEASSDPAEGTVVTASPGRNYYTLDTTGDGAADVLIRYEAGDTFTYTMQVDGAPTTSTITMAEFESYLGPDDVLDPGTYQPGSTAHVMVDDRPATPKNMAAAVSDLDGDGAADDVTASWDAAPNPNVVHYSLSRAPAPTDGSEPLYDEIAKVAAGTTEYEDLNRPAGNYLYRVNAFSADNFSESSEPAEASVVADA